MRLGSVFTDHNKNFHRPENLKSHAVKVWFETPRCVRIIRKENIMVHQSKTTPFTDVR
jgi:hypothetical protein